MHLVLQLAGLVLLAWHSSGYAINDADSSEYYDDFEHVNRQPTYYDEIEVYEDTIPLLEEIYRLSGDELDEIMKLIATLQADELYSEEEVIRPKRSKLHDAKVDSTEDKVTTEHIVIPKHEKQRTKEVQQVKNEEIHKTNGVTKAVDTTDRILREVDIEIKEMKSMEHETEKIDEFLLKEEDIINKEFMETESMEDVIENVNALLMLEEEFLAKKERGSSEKIYRSARNSEWLGPIYLDYPWYPTWYPPYPCNFYQGWPPYFNPYPMAFPVNLDDGFNPGSCDGVTKQYVPVRGKATIATSFADGTWTMPASCSTPKICDPCFYPDYDYSIPYYGSYPSNEPVATDYDRSVTYYQPDNVINAPITNQGTIPVSGKVTIAAHFPC